MDRITAISTLRGRPYGLTFDDAALLTDYAQAVPGDVVIWDVPDSGRPLSRILVRWHAGEQSFKLARTAGAGTPVL